MDKTKPRQIRGKLTPAKLKMAMPHVRFDKPMTHVEIWEAADAILNHFGWTDKEWWNVFEYIDFHANGSKFTDLKFSAWLEDLERATPANPTPQEEERE